MTVDNARVARVKTIMERNRERDQRMSEVRMVRTGNAHLMFSSIFPADWPKPMIANTIDVIAQDVSEQVGVMPTFTASGDSIIDPTARKRADKRTKLVNHYAWSSRLGVQLPAGADKFVTYGFLPVRVEANYDAQRPHIRLDDPFGAYYTRDRWDCVVEYIRVFEMRASVLERMYPEVPMDLGRGYMGQNDPMIQLARVFDKDSTQIIILDSKASGTIVSSMPNRLGRVPVAIAERPTLDGEQRGVFDDVLWVYAARAKLALLSLEATEKAVEAPIVAPDDVDEINLGPDSILRTSQPQAVQRLRLDVPPSAFVADQKLDEEIKFGARFPQERAGSSDASVVTGKGVQALMSGFDARVRTHQSILGEALNDALSICLEMDERLWGDTEKTVHSVANGTPYELTYKPAQAIKGQYSVNYEYGVMAGLDPNRALVWGLQGLGANLFSKGWMRRQLPVGLDVEQEERVIDVERLREAALTAVEATAQAIPQLAANGADPSQLLHSITAVIDARKRGTEIEGALGDAFAPPKPPAAAESPAPDAATPPGTSDTGQATPGGATIRQPQELPSLQSLLSQLAENGSTQSSVRTIRQSRL